MSHEVFDAYWHFAVERQRIYHARVRGEQRPWTDDPILSSYRFTNVYRASDRISQYLIKSVIYDGTSRDATDTIFRILLFKIFNSRQTWELLNEACGQVVASEFDPGAAIAALDRAMSNGERIYSPAYIVPPVPGNAGQRKHHGHIHLVVDLLDSGKLDELARATTLENLYRLLLDVPGFGPFLAYQFAIDLNYSAVFDFDENEFVVAGPGAIDGLVKCFGTSAGHAPEAMITRVWSEQEEELQERGLEFAGLWGRRMSLIDVQNLFCEISKYSRVSHPEVMGSSGRTRIKQTYRPGTALELPVFPPKWNLHPTYN